jgi:hypothetical protein
MNPTPANMPSGRRIRSRTTKESEVLPTLFMSQLVCSVAYDFDTDLVTSAKVAGRLGNRDFIGGFL